MRLRIIYKTLSWRVIGTLTTITLSYLLTGSSALAISLGVVDAIVKSFLYYLHERVWN